MSTSKYFRALKFYALLCTQEQYPVSTLYHWFSYFSLILNKIRVRIGEWDFSSTSEPHAHVERKIVEKIVHPKYNFFTYEYDLALLKLERRVDFQDNIIPICLPGNNDLLIGKKIHLSGHA